MKSQIRHVDDHGVQYDCLAFICPGCETQSPNSTGLHMLPVNTTLKEPAWAWDGNLELPTISPSILTGRDSKFVCHSFLKEGVFQFLTDSTHSLSGQSVLMPDLPEWFVKELEEDQ